MKVLIPENDGYCRDLLQGFVEHNQYKQVSGIAVDADGSPERVIARELRGILDGCPICQSGFRDHTYCLLATVVMNKKAADMARLAQFLGCMCDCRWHDLLGFREWSASADTIVVFAFRCDRGRVGIVTVFSPAESDVPDESLQFTILSLGEGKKLLAAVGPERWMHLRPDASSCTSIPLQFRSA